MLLEVLEIPVEEKLYAKSYVSLWYCSFGKREIQEFFRTKIDPKGRCGIYFTFTHLCGLLVPMLLEGFLFQFYF